MAYIKQTWLNGLGGGTPLSAARLNYMETGISTANGLIYSVKESTYAAVGDGVADDSAAIQAAINDASTAGGGVVYLPKGTYKLLSYLVPKSKVSIVGEGIGRTILKPTGSIAAIRDIATGTSNAPLTDMVFEDFEIDGSDQTVPGGVYTSAVKGLYILYMSRCFIRRLYVHDVAATGIGVDFMQDSAILDNVANGCGRLGAITDPGASGIGLGVGSLSATFENTIIRGNHCRGNKRFGIFLETQAGASNMPLGTIIEGNYCSDNRGGIGEAGGRGTLIRGNICRNNVLANIVCNTGTFGPGVPGKDTIIEGNILEASQTYGIYIESLTGETIDKIKITNNRIYDNTSIGVIVRTTDTVGKSVVISDNDIYENGGAGVYFATTSAGSFQNCAVRNNRLWNNGKTHATVKEAIGIDVNMAGIIIDSNHCFDLQGSKTQTWGIKLWTGRTISDLWIDGNDLRGNLSGAFTSAATLSAWMVGQNPGYTVNSGAPESAVVAPVGTVYRRTDGGAATSMYVKESGTGNTGWVAK